MKFAGKTAEFCNFVKRQFRAVQEIFAFSTRLSCNNAEKACIAAPANETFHALPSAWRRNDILPPRQFYLCMLYAPVSYGNYFTGNP